MKIFRACLLFTMMSCFSQGAEYDPMAIGKADVVSKTFELKDDSRNRTVPLRIYLPASSEAAPVILFSHGLGGSRDNNPYLGNHWAASGYVVVFIQHPGSDESVWKEVPARKRIDAMKGAASVQNVLDRGTDIPAVISALEVWNGEKDHALKGRLDLKHIGMSGHSFGAVTTQGAAGQGMGGATTKFLEKRIDAAVMMSPSLPRRGDPAKAFSTITIPCLLMTGTRDDSPIGDSTAADRVKVFPNLTNAPAWQVVFDGATHMDFGQREGMEKESRYHKAILALTTAFWDAQLHGDKAAMKWLNGEGAREVLEKIDTWKKNDRAK